MRFSELMGGCIGGLALRNFWGEKDIAFREKERAQFATIFPGAKSIALSGAGHYVQEESSDEIAAAIRAWWSADAQAEK